MQGHVGYLVLFFGSGDPAYKGHSSSAFRFLKARNDQDALKEIEQLMQEMHVAPGAFLDSVKVCELYSVDTVNVKEAWVRILKDSERNRKMDKLRDLAEQLVNIQEEIDKLQRELRSE